MKSILIAAAAFLLAAAAASAADRAYYRVETSPSGSMIASDLPVLKGNTYLFHGYPSGTLVSLRRSDVRRIVQIPAAAAAQTNPADRVVSIGNLAMQGGSAQAGATNASATRKAAGPEIGKGFYGNVVPGVTEGMPNSPNDYQVGRTFAAPPGNAVQSAPGEPPMMAPSPPR
jgi:opacity protein-like surface antigen